MVANGASAVILDGVSKSFDGVRAVRGLSAQVPAGTIYVELWNRGQDTHDTWVRRLNSHGTMVGPVLDKVKQTLPGHISHATWHLKAGKYELFCSMPGHMKLGMHARLTVT